LSVGTALGDRQGEFLQRRLEEPKKAAKKRATKSEGHVHDPFATWQKNLYDGDPDELEIDKRIADELKTWQKFELKHFQKSNRKTFTAFKLPPYISHAIIDGLGSCSNHTDIKALFANVMNDPAIKSVQTYQRATRELATALWRGDISAREFEDRFRPRMTRSLEEAFIDGLEQGGLSREDLEPEDFDDLIETTGREETFIAPLATYISDNSRAKGGRLNVIRSRVDRWAATYSSTKELGFMVAKSTANLLWKYDPRKEHCRDCARLNGKVYKGRTWKKYDIRPQSKELACFGLWCGCQFEETDKPVNRGRPPALTGRKSTIDWLNIKTEFDEPKDNNGETIDQKPETEKPENTAPDEKPENIMAAQSASDSEKINNAEPNGIQFEQK
jgi:hypothetical protein